MTMLDLCAIAALILVTEAMVLMAISDIKEYLADRAFGHLPEFRCIRSRRAYQDALRSCRFTRILRALL